MLKTNFRIDLTGFCPLFFVHLSGGGGRNVVDKKRILLSSKILVRMAVLFWDYVFFDEKACFLNPAVQVPPRIGRGS
ncbi:hypothetical protein [Enterococcus sp. AZ163]|uniref:hypothetical protein n=1 Tax=Enterococcus sp. AZ163 TaxID=2774638 RepID=UPI003D2CE178